ncbi:MAG: hypothetical protein WC496_03210 [Phycisphaerae bacterium]|jgi:hypothetical protein
MATITFHCPKCKDLCAFKDIYAGRRAKCLRCDQVFIIPTAENVKVQKVEPSKDFDDPLPGFYEAVFKNSWRAIFDKQSLTALVFIFTAVSLKFFTIHLDYSFRIVGPAMGFTVLLPVGFIITAFVWGGIFWYYAEIIYSTAFDVEILPQIEFGGGFGYMFKVVRSFYAVFIALLMSLLPAIIAKIIFNLFGVSTNWVIMPFVILGMFLFPMAILTVSISRDLLMLFRPDYFFAPIRKAFWHYLFLAGLFILAWQLQYASPNYEDVADKSGLTILLCLLAVLAIQILAVFTMRATGLFYRHFACFFGW